MKILSYSLIAIGLSLALSSCDTCITCKCETETIISYKNIAREPDTTIVPIAERNTCVAERLVNETIDNLEKTEVSESETDETKQVLTTTCKCTED